MKYRAEHFSGTWAVAQYKAELAYLIDRYHERGYNWIGAKAMAERKLKNRIGAPWQRDR